MRSLCRAECWPCCSAARWQIGPHPATIQLSGQKRRRGRRLCPPASHLHHPGISQKYIFVLGEQHRAGGFTMFGFLNYSIFHVGFSFFHFTIHVVVAAGRPLAPVVTSRSMSRWARQHELSWTCDTVSSLLEYEIAYKNKWSKVCPLIT